MAQPRPDVPQAGAAALKERVTAKACDKLKQCAIVETWNSRALVETWNSRPH